MRLQWRAKFKGLRAFGKIIKAYQVPIVASFLRNVQLIARNMEWRPFPAIRGFDFNQPLSAVCRKTLDVVTQSIPVLLRDPANFLSQIVSTASVQSCTLMVEDPFFPC